MEHFFGVTIQLISQFTGGQGGIEYGIVHFGIAAMFWLVLLILAWLRQRQSSFPHERILLLGFCLGFGRELFMVVMVSLPIYGLIDVDFLHVFFPPLEHAVFDIAVVTVAAGYMQYLLQNEVLPMRYLKIGIVMVLLCYFATFLWWSRFIIANPASKFGQTWCDWLFRINASILLAIPIAVLASRTRGWVRNAVTLALLFFFLDQFLKILDMALGEVYEWILAPLRHGFYMIGILVFGYVYIRELYEERERAVNDLQKAHDTLEQKVRERTAELARKIEEVKVLGGLLPICSSCKKIRDDSGYWNQIETYIRNHSEVEFSHSICPECAGILYPDLFVGSKENIVVEDRKMTIHKDISSRRSARGEK